MNAPQMMITGTPTSPIAGNRSMASQATNVDLCDLTLDELRELPMHMQMGLDLSALD